MKEHGVLPGMIGPEFGKGRPDFSDQETHYYLSFSLPQRYLVHDTVDKLQDWLAEAEWYLGTFQQSGDSERNKKFCSAHRTPSWRQWFRLSGSLLWERTISTRQQYTLLVCRKLIHICSALHDTEIKSAVDRIRHPINEHVQQQQ
jgi:hypothetical protein